VGVRGEEGGESKKIQAESKWIRPILSGASRPEESVSQVWTVRRSSLWMDLQMFALRNLAASAVEVTESYFHRAE
jgi:hypothetical protein